MPPWNSRGKLHVAGRRSLSLWRRGAELLLGPWCEPGHSACWNCCRVRLSDLLLPDGEGQVEHDAALVRAVAENVVLAVRYPELTPYGCVVSDMHQTTALHSVVPLPWCPVCGGAVEMPEAELTPCGRTLVVPDELAGAGRRPRRHRATRGVVRHRRPLAAGLRQRGRRAVREWRPCRAPPSRGKGKERPEKRQFAA